MFESTQPGPELAIELAACDPGTMCTEDLLEFIAACERQSSWTAAVQIEAMAEFTHRRPMVEAPRDTTRTEEFCRYAADELACALNLATVTAGKRLCLASDLDTHLRATLSALRSGEITLPKARVIAERTNGLSDEARRTVEAHALCVAPQRAPGELRRIVDRAVFAADPTIAERRHAKAARARAAAKRPEPDGMASLRLTSTAEAITATWNGLTWLATAAKRGGDTRGLDALRVDTLVELVRHAAECGCHRGARCDRTQGPHASPSKPLVHVTVAATTLAGLDDEPGHLDGYGPIPAGLARLIAANADWKRILTDPQSGAVLDVGRTRYTPTSAIMEFVEIRDRTCRFPGCLQPAARCDLDHTVPFPHGPTSAANLHALCRRHHRLKQHPGWRVEVDSDQPGTLRWTSPTGRVYVTTPPAAGEAA